MTNNDIVIKIMDGENLGYVLGVDAAKRAIAENRLSVWEEIGYSRMIEVFGGDWTKGFMETIRHYKAFAMQ